jgi:hypothetical protein
MKLVSYAATFIMMMVFVSTLAFSADEVNISKVLWETGVITQEQGESEDMASSWDENGSPNFPYKAYDGDMETKWCTQAEDVSWLMIDFAEPRLVSKFVLYMSGNTTHGGDFGKWIYNFAEFQIQSSMTGDENSWMDEVVVQGNPPDEEHGILTYEIDPKPMQWVRLYITNQGVDTHARLPEFEVWGSLTIEASPVSPRGKLATTWASVRIGS